MFGGFRFAALALAAILAAGSDAAFAQNYRPPVVVRQPPRAVQPPTPNLRAKISPSQAAAIALRQMPGAKVVGVKLLPSGVYAVTLKSASSVARIMVNAGNGAVM